MDAWNRLRKPGSRSSGAILSGRIFGLSRAACRLALAAAVCWIASAAADGQVLPPAAGTPKTPAPKKTTKLTPEEEQKLHGKHSDPLVIDPAFLIVEELPAIAVSAAEMKDFSKLFTKNALNDDERKLIRKVVNSILADTTRRANLKNIPAVLSPLRGKSRTTTGLFRDIVGQKLLDDIPILMKNNLAVRANVLILARDDYPYEPMIPALCAILADPKQHVAVKFLAIQVIGRLGADRIRSFQWESQALDALLALLETKDLDLLLRREVYQALGQIGRPDGQGTDAGRRAGNRMPFLIGHVLCEAASDPALHLAVRVTAAEAPAGFRPPPDMAIPTKPIGLAIARVAIALCDALESPPGLLGVEVNPSEEAPNPAEVQKLLRREVFIHSYRLLSAVQRLREGYGARDAALADLEEALKEVTLDLGRAWTRPESNRPLIKQAKAAVEKWLSAQGEKTP